jgi:hypothetical protein
VTFSVCVSDSSSAIYVNIYTISVSTIIYLLSCLYETFGGYMCHICQYLAYICHNWIISHYSCNIAICSTFVPINGREIYDSLNLKQHIII